MESNIFVTIDLVSFGGGFRTAGRNNFHFMFKTTHYKKEPNNRQYICRNLGPSHAEKNKSKSRVAIITSTLSPWHLTH